MNMGLFEGPGEWTDDMGRRCLAEKERKKRSKCAIRLAFDVQLRIRGQQDVRTITTHRLKVKDALVYLSKAYVVNLHCYGTRLHQEGQDSGPSGKLKRNVIVRFLQLWLDSCMCVTASPRAQVGRPHTSDPSHGCPTPTDDVRRASCKY